MPAALRRSAKARIIGLNGTRPLRRNRSLWSRIHQCRLSLGAPTVADTTEYVEHRLHQAGSTDLLFGAVALTILHEATRGQLRDIDRVATNAMRLAARGARAR